MKSGEGRSGFSVLTKDVLSDGGRIVRNAAEKQRIVKPEAAGLR